MVDVPAAPVNRSSDSEGPLWRLVAKCVTTYVRVRHGSHAAGHRYFIRQRYLSALFQLRYWWKDSVLRTPHATIAFDGEFSPELKFVIPHAYWHHLNGTLLRTIGCAHTRDLYFFSPDHEERYTTRRWNDFHFPLEIPNSEDHNVRYAYGKWAPVPWRSHFGHGHFTYAKPTLVIANRYNTEWTGEPVSYFGTEELRTLLGMLADRYQVIYNRPAATAIVNDESEVMDLNEKAVIRSEFPSVILLEDLMSHPNAMARSFNHLQLMVYADCERFISIHGGTATLASCFGGTNIIYSRKGHEHYFGEFKSIYPRLSDAMILPCRTMEEVMKEVGNRFVADPPVAAHRP